MFFPPVLCFSVLRFFFVDITLDTCGEPRLHVLFSLWQLSCCGTSAYAVAHVNWPLLNYLHELVVDVKI